MAVELVGLDFEEMTEFPTPIADKVLLFGYEGTLYLMTPDGTTFNLAGYTSGATPAVPVVINASQSYTVLANTQVSAPDITIEDGGMLVIEDGAIYNDLG